MNYETKYNRLVEKLNKAVEEIEEYSDPENLPVIIRLLIQCNSKEEVYAHTAKTAADCIRDILKEEG